MTSDRPTSRSLPERARLRALFHATWGTLALSGPLLEVMSPATTARADWVWPLGLAAFAPAAALILIRRPANAVGRVLAVVAVAGSVLFNGGWVVTTWPDSSFGLLLEPLLSATVPVTFWGMIALLFIFPTGKSQPGWSRWAFRSITAGLLGLVPLLMLINPGPMEVSGRANPLGVEAAWVGPFLEGSLASLVVGAVLGVAALVQRFVRAEGIERAQLKWFVGGSGLVLTLVLLVAMVPEEYDQWAALTGALVVLGFWALPTSIVAAILRYRLYDIDRIASRTVTYLIVTGLLGAGYTGMLVALQSLLPTEGAFPVAASTLVMAWLSIPLLRVVQRVVDRRFFRSRYDAQEVVAGFTSVLRSNLGLDQVTESLTEVVSETFEPGHVSVWIPQKSP